MKETKKQKFTFRMTDEQFKILGYLCQVEDERPQEVLRTMITLTGLQKGYLTAKYNFDPAVFNDR